MFRVKCGSIFIALTIRTSRNVIEKYSIDSTHQCVSRLSARGVAAPPAGPQIPQHKLKYCLGRPDGPAPLQAKNRHLQKTRRCSCLRWHRTRVCGDGGRQWRSASRLFTCYTRVSVDILDQKKYAKCRWHKSAISCRPLLQPG